MLTRRKRLYTETAPGSFPKPHRTQLRPPHFAVKTLTCGILEEPGLRCHQACAVLCPWDVLTPPPRSLNPEPARPIPPSSTEGFSGRPPPAWVIFDHAMDLFSDDIPMHVGDNVQRCVLLFTRLLSMPLGCEPHEEQPTSSSLTVAPQILAQSLIHILYLIYFY